MLYSGRLQVLRMVASCLRLRPGFVGGRRTQTRSLHILPGAFSQEKAMTAEHRLLPVKRALPIIRVFVSSTFSDLKLERNALHAQVWPELERYCQQRGFTFQAIDLRWGVPAEAGLDHRTMRICFEELRRSQETSPEPNFLILLGNRYGWRPLPEVISVEDFEKLKTAAQQIQSAPPDPAEQLSDEQVELLKNSAAVLEDWYLLDENAKPFGDKTLRGEYVLRTRKTLLRGVHYGKETVGNNFGSRSRETSDRTLTSSATTGSDAGPIRKQPDATGKLQDTPAWVDVQFVLWSIVNREKIPDTPRRGDFIDLKDDKKSPDGDASHPRLACRTTRGTAIDLCRFIAALFRSLCPC